MKKIFVLVCSLMFASMTVFAVDVSLGFRGGLNLNLGTTPAGNFKESIDVAKSLDSNIKTKTLLGGEFGIYLNLGISDVGPCVFGMSFGADVALRNGYAIKNGNDWSGFLINALDIPLLVTCNIPIADSMRLGLGLGGFIGFPFGLHAESKINSSVNKTSTVDSKHLAAGLLVDVNYGFRVGRGYIFFDVRYLLDLLKTEGRVGTAYLGVIPMEEVFTRRTLTLGLGYEILF